MATHGKIDEFDPSHEAWATYVERLEFYFIANGIEDPEKKRAVLLTVSGPATCIQVDPVSQRIRSPRKSDPGRIRYASDIDPTLADSIRGINGVSRVPTVDFSE